MIGDDSVKAMDTRIVQDTEKKEGPETREVEGVWLCQILEDN